MTTMTPHYRRTKTGDWVVCGPASIVRPDCTVTVHKRDGSTKMEEIDRVGKTFRVDGIDLRYGYPPPGPRNYTPRRGGGGRRIPAYDRCIGCGGNGSVEQELGECAACGRDCDA